MMPESFSTSCCSEMLLASPTPLCRAPGKASRVAFGEPGVPECTGCSLNLLRGHQNPVSPTVPWPEPAGKISILTAGLILGQIILLTEPVMQRKHRGTRMPFQTTAQKENSLNVCETTSLEVFCFLAMSRLPKGLKAVH